MSEVRMIPQMIPVTMTTMEDVEKAEDKSKVDLDPVTALESVTPKKVANSKINFISSLENRTFLRI